MGTEETIKRLSALREENAGQGGGAAATIDRLRALREPEEEDAGTFNLLDMSRQVAQGLTFDFADDAEALLAGVVGYDADEYQRQVNERNRAYEERNPWTSFGLRVGGGVAGGGLAGAGLRAVGRGVGGMVGRGLESAGRGADYLFNVRPQAGASIAQTVGAGARAGAAGGALAGAGAADGGLEQRALGAIEGSVWGAGGGAVLAPAFRALGGVVGRASDEVAGSGDAPNRGVAQADRMISRRFNELGIDAEGMMAEVFGDMGAKANAVGPVVARQIVRGWANGEKASEIASKTFNPKTEKPYGVDTIKKYLGQIEARTGKGRGLVDLVDDHNTSLGRPLVAAARAAYSRGGQEMGVIEESLRARQAGTQERLVEEIEGATGANANAVRQSLGDRGSASDGLRSSYEALQDAPPIWLSSPTAGRVRGMVGDQVIAPLRRNSQEFRRAEQAARDDLANDAAINGLFRPGRDGQNQRLENLYRDEDYFDFNLIDQIQKNIRAQAVGGSANNFARGRIFATRQKFLNWADSLFDDEEAFGSSFKKLRDTYRDRIVNVEAFELGAAVARQSSQSVSEGLEQFLQRRRAGLLNKGEEQAFRRGAGAGLIDRVMRQFTGSKPSGALQTPEMDLKLKDIFGDERGGRLADAFARERAMSDRVNYITRGSQTAATLEGLQQDKARGLWSRVANPMRLIEDAAEWIDSQVAAGKYREAARLLSTTDERQAIQILDRIARMQRNIEARDTMAAEAAARASRKISEQGGRESATDRRDAYYDSEARRER